MTNLLDTTWFTSVWAIWSGTLFNQYWQRSETAPSNNTLSKCCPNDVCKFSRVHQQKFKGLNPKRATKQKVKGAAVSSYRWTEEAHETATEGTAEVSTGDGRDDVRLPIAAVSPAPAAVAGGGAGRGRRREPREGREGEEQPRRHGTGGVDPAEPVAFELWSRFAWGSGIGPGPCVGLWTDPHSWRSISLQILDSTMCPVINL